MAPAQSKGLCIGDVAKICGVPTHTIRFWEKEFGVFLTPVRTRGKQRRYSDTDIRHVAQIKKLLWVDKFSIEGAKRLMDGDHIATMLNYEDKVEKNDNVHELALQIAHLISQRMNTAGIAA